MFGGVESARLFQFGELLAIPTVKVRCDIHCVTRWSKFDTGRNSIQWEGILFRDFLEVIRVKPEVKYVMSHADPDYETNVPLADLLRDGVLLAFRFSGEPLTDKRGWLPRTVVPRRYSGPWPRFAAPAPAPLWRWPAMPTPIRRQRTICTRTLSHWR